MFKILIFKIYGSIENGIAVSAIVAIHPTFIFATGRVFPEVIVAIFTIVMIFGLLICPLPYLAAAKFGTTSFINQTEGLLILSISWAFIMITIHYLLKTLR